MFTIFDLEINYKGLVIRVQDIDCHAAIKQAFKKQVKKIVNVEREENSNITVNIYGTAHKFYYKVEFGSAA